MLFKPNTFVVGSPIPTVEYNWYAPTTNHWARQAIPGQEIKDAYQTHANQFNEIAGAQVWAETLAQDAFVHDTSNCAFMKYECPIFELNGDKILFAHFQGNKFSYELLHALNKPHSVTDSCIII